MFGGRCHRREGGENKTFQYVLLILALVLILIFLLICSSFYDFHLLSQATHRFYGSSIFRLNPETAIVPTLRTFSLCRPRAKEVQLQAIGRLLFPYHFHLSTSMASCR